jgi:hypothetical protein
MTVTHDCAEVNEYVIAAAALNKAETFSVVEPFNYALFTTVIS